MSLRGTEAVIRWAVVTLIPAILTAAGSAVVTAYMLGQRIQGDRDTRVAVETRLIHEIQTNSHIITDLARRVCLVELNGRSKDSRCPEYITGAQ